MALAVLGGVLLTVLPYHTVLSHLFMSEPSFVLGSIILGLLATNGPKGNGSLATAGLRVGSDHSSAPSARRGSAAAAVLVASTGWLSSLAVRTCRVRCRPLRAAVR